MTCWALAHLASENETLLAKQENLPVPDYWAALCVCALPRENRTYSMSTRGQPGLTIDLSLLTEMETVQNDKPVYVVNQLVISCC